MNWLKLVSARFLRPTGQGYTSVPFTPMAFAPSKESGTWKRQVKVWRGLKVRGPRLTGDSVLRPWLRSHLWDGTLDFPKVIAGELGQRINSHLALILILLVVQANSKSGKSYPSRPPFAKGRHCS